MRYGMLCGLIMLCLAGCVRLTAGVYPESYKPQFRGWITGYATHTEMRGYDGTILKVTTFSDAERPGELLSLDLWPIAGIGIGPIGARVRVLPFGIGFGTIAYDPQPLPAAAKKSKKKKQ